LVIIAVGSIREFEIRRTEYHLHHAGVEHESGVRAAEAERNSEDVRARFGSGFLAGLRVDFFRMLQAVAGFG
jgi:hypothetical protein